MRRPPPRSTLSPNTTLFRSQHRDLPGHEQPLGRLGGLVDGDEPVAVAGQTLAGDPQPPDVEHLELLPDGDRKSTRLNSSHANISYAVFCLKKKKLIDTPNAG